MSQNFDQLTANTIFNSTDVFPINFDDAWQAVGYSRKDSALRILTSQFAESIDFIVSHKFVEKS